MKPDLKEDFRFVRKYLETFSLGSVLRWRKENEEAFRTIADRNQLKEDLLQHGAGMQILATLLLLKATEEGDDKITSLNPVLITIMVFIHDAEEILIGDARYKTTAYQAKEIAARAEIYKGLNKLNIGPAIIEVALDYLRKGSPESRFVKALDEIQAWAYLIVSDRVEESTRDFAHPEGIIGFQYAAEFPILHRVAIIFLRCLKQAQVRAKT